ncbi:replication-relaxation family protein [Streptomyces niveus]|uniref:replication-relaxation family protein n=1 Tax=Streptomyces niveus TaxID=193462 RepID=UPI0036D3BE1F
MAGKRKTNAAGSSNGLRGDVLRALGVLKVATADQMQRLCSPHLTYRHTLKKTASVRKEARTASHRGAANDLRRHGLSVDGGRTRGGEEVRLLTATGLEAAGIELDRIPQEMGGMPKTAGRSGASHAMTVNETVIAMIRPKPDLDQLTKEPAEAQVAARAAVDAPEGIGTLVSYATEVGLPATGTWKNPGIGSAWADIVLIAPESGVPLLFIEADNCTEEAVLIAAKFDKYMRFYQRTVKDTDGKERPMWRTRWPVPQHRFDDASHPPVLLVFHQFGKRSATGQMKTVAGLTRQHWQGAWDSEYGFHTYDGKIPIVATTLESLREHGPAGPAFWRFGRRGRQSLLDAIGNPRRHAALTRAVEQREAEAGRRAEEEVAEQEARRPVCEGCGTKFTDDRWKAVDTGGWGRWETHPHLCDDCKALAVKSRHRAELAAREEAAAEEARALEEEHRRMDEEAAAERKARRFPFPFRSRP